MELSNGELNNNELDNIKVAECGISIFDAAKYPKDYSEFVNYTTDLIKAAETRVHRSFMVARQNELNRYYRPDCKLDALTTAYSLLIKSFEFIKNTANDLAA